MFEIISLGIAVGLGVLNIIQFQKQLQMKRETLKPIYNGLIGLFNDVKNKGTHCYGRQNLLFGRDNPYNNVQILKWNFFEFITETINHFQSLREHIVPILKTIEPSEDRVFKEANFAVAKEEKEARKRFGERWEIQEKIRHEIELTKLGKELEQLKSVEGSSKKD